MGLRTLLGLTGEELTVEDYENAFTRVPLVTQASFDTIMTENKSKKDEIRTKDAEITKLQAQVASVEQTGETELETMRLRIEEMEKNTLRVTGISMFIDAGYDKERAELMFDMFDTSNGTDKIETYLADEKTRKEAQENASAREKGKVANPKASTNPGAPTKEKLRERFDQLAKDMDSQGLVAFRKDHPEEFAEFNSGTEI